MNFLEETRKILPYMQEFRRELHENPELSMEEFETTNRIERELNKLGLKCTRFNPTGLMADVVGAQPGKTIALRADIDALPIMEDTGLEFSSKVPGKMHACGHDVHTAQLLGAAKILVENKDKIKGTVRLIFQPSEENGKGALTIIDQGAVDGVDYIFGLHIMEFIGVGMFGGREGAQMAGAETFTMTVHGVSHHGGMPQVMGGVDVIAIASEIVMSAQTIVSRKINPLDAAVVSFCTFNAGSGHNIIPGEAVLSGTIRYQSEETRELIKKQLLNIADGIAKVHGGSAEIEWGQNISPVINDEFIANVAFKAAEKITGDPKKMIHVKGTTGSEDFGAYSKVTKACFFTVGVGGKYPGHHPKLVINEEAMPYGSAMLLQTAFDLMDAEV